MKPMNESVLREAALAHLARFAATEAGLKRVLDRQVMNWTRKAEAAGAEPETVQAAARAAKAAIPQIVASIRAVGAVDDAAFAASRARRLTREGKSRRMALAHLAAKGVEQDLAASVLPEDPARDLAAACGYLKRRRLPPFSELNDTIKMKALASLARAGYSRDIAEKALSLDYEAADAILRHLRSDQAG
jgi:regulatory protein